VETSWSLRKDFIKGEIDIRVESLKNDLDNLRDDLFSQIDKEYDEQM
jgi:hypothetical protein